MRLLDECLTSARSGKASVVLIRGEAGIGKSRLAQTIMDQARQDAVLVALGHCTPVTGSELPFGPFVEMLTQIAAEPDLPETGDSTWDNLRAALTVSGSFPGVVSPDVGLERSRLFTSVLQLLHNLGGRRPVLAVVEDIHWADSSSLDLLNYLARTAAQERLLLVLTCRDPDGGQAPSARKAIADLMSADPSREIRLAPLTADEVRQLLETSTSRSQPRSATR